MFLKIFSKVSKVWGIIFFQTSLELEIFSRTYDGIRFFFSALYVIGDIFFNAGYLFSHEYICMLFRLEISLQDIFPETTHNPLKIKMVGP